MYEMALRYAKMEYLNKYIADGLTSMYAGFLDPRRTSDGKRMGVSSDPSRDRSGPASMFSPGMQRYCRGRWFHDPVSGHRGL